MGRKAWIDRLPETTDDACYRAMEWLRQVKDSVQKEIFGQVATLLNLEVGLLFFDTTSTYFEFDEEDGPVPRDRTATRLVTPVRRPRASQPGSGLAVDPGKSVA